MKAMVTGATGFVGSHLAHTLKENGWEVSALARSPHKAAALANQGIQVVPGDLSQPETLRTAVRDADVVFHVAGAVAARNEAAYLATNRDGTARLVAACEERGVGRFVLVSSLAAAGPSTKQTPHDEDRSPSPLTAYGRSKLASEDVVRDSSLPWTILRPPTVYGPRDSELLTVFRMARFGVAPVFGDGSQRLSAIFAPDLAAGLLTAATSGQTMRQTYFISHPEVCTSRELIRTIGESLHRQVHVLPLPRIVGSTLLTLTGALATVTGRTTILNADKAREFFAEAWTCSPQRLADATGWSAPTPLIAGIAQTTEWYRRNDWL